jgi:cytochrome c-type biogenesis protein
MKPPKWLAQSLAKYERSQPLLLGLLFGCIVLLIWISDRIDWAVLSQPLQNWVFALEDSYQQQVNPQQLESPLLLLPIAFGGGLIASLSPCVLSLLPVNLSYIGTREMTSRWDAFLKAGSFVLGAITTLSLFGLFSSFAASVMVSYRGYIQVAVGAFIILMGLTLLGIVRLPLPQTHWTLPVAGAYGVGLTFALVSSPCSSPVLFAILAAAATTGSLFHSTLTMVSYALGYTAVIFVASLFAGLVKQTRLLLKHSTGIVRFGSVVLVLLGGYYLVAGMRWVAADWFGPG